MGSYNVTCDVSHCSIHPGDDCAVLLLSKTGDPNKYSTTGYETFPVVIRGTYGDYGHLEDIVRSPGVLALERNFKLPIEDLLESILNSSDLYDYFRSYKGYFKPQVFDYLKGSSTEPRSLTDTFLKLLGFVQIEQPVQKNSHLNKFPENFTYWQHPDYLNFIVLLQPRYFLPGYHETKTGPRRHDDDTCFIYEQAHEIWWQKTYDPVFNPAEFFRIMQTLTKDFIGFVPEYKETMTFVSDIKYVWVHGKVLDNMAIPLPDDLGNLATWYGQESFIMGHDLLIKFGFIQDADLSKELEAKQWRYCKVYRHPSSSDYVVRFDNRSAHIDRAELTTDNAILSMTFSLEKLLSKWEKLTGFKFELSEEELATCSQRLLFRQLSDWERAREKRGPDTILDRYPSSPNYPLNDIFRASSSQGNGWLDSTSSKVFLSEIKDGSLENEFVQTRWLDQNLWQIAHPLTPHGYNGPQFGNHDVAKVLGETIISLSENRYEDDEDDEDEDED